MGTERQDGRIHIVMAIVEMMKVEKNVYEKHHSLSEMYRRCTWAHSGRDGDGWQWCGHDDDCSNGDGDGDGDGEANGW